MDVTAINELEAWWIELAAKEAKPCAAKAVEYGSYDLHLIGKVLESVMGDEKKRQLTEQGVTAEEFGTFFYLLGKVARMASAYRDGTRPSDDTMTDAGVYVRMIQRIRETGDWPGVREPGMPNRNWTGPVTRVCLNCIHTMGIHARLGLCTIAGCSCPGYQDGPWADAETGPESAPPPAAPEGAAANPGQSEKVARENWEDGGQPVRALFWTGEPEQAPIRHHEGDAGFDLVLAESGIIQRGKGMAINVRCGIKVVIPTGCWGLVIGRSSTSRKGLLVNPAVIDEGWRGEMFVGVWNMTGQDIQINKGDRIAQLVPIKRESARMFSYRMDEDHYPAPVDSRGENGFGSTG